MNRLGSTARKLPVLRPKLTEQDFVNKLARGDFKSVVVCTGAGVSTSAGIPDFRSAGGLFELIRSTWGERFPEVLKSPEALLSRDFVRAHADVWASEVQPWLSSLRWGSAQPTTTHWFCAWLHRQGILRRVYTQNVDGLHVAPELNMPAEKVVECHGALRDGSIVLYGDTLPRRFDSMCKEDFPTASNQCKVDLLLVLGTSLQVAPFCALPNMAPKGCTRVLVCRPLSECMTNNWSKRRDCYYYGNCDDLGGMSMPSTTALGDWKEASLRPLWTDPKANRRWTQLLVEDWCDDFVERLFVSNPSLSQEG